MANERSMDWDDPAARARLIEDVGPGEYKRRFEEHCRESTVLVVNGYTIRRIGPLLKRLFLVEGTDTASGTTSGKRAARNGHSPSYSTIPGRLSCQRTTMTSNGFRWRTLLTSEL